MLGFDRIRSRAPRFILDVDMQAISFARLAEVVERLDSKSKDEHVVILHIVVAGRIDRRLQHFELGFHGDGYLSVKDGVLAVCW